MCVIWCFQFIYVLCLVIKFEMLPKLTYIFELLKKLTQYEQKQK